MGTLIAMKYPTSLFANQADHTYVKCGTNRKAWGCWGGKSGGSELKRGTGSTKRADAIAESNERAGIKCYLVNGVCHQAANRILLPAGILVSGARGYSISEALFGPYGRLGVWPCRAPFNKRQGVSGDLDVCVEAAPKTTTPKAVSRLALTAAQKLDWHYINGVLELYDEAAPLLKARAVTPEEATALHLKLFMFMAEFHLGPMMDKGLSRRLAQVRTNTEKARLKMEEPFAKGEADPREFVETFNEITLAFQDEMATVLTAEQYLTLFQLQPGEQVVLADQRIVAKVFRVK